MAPDHATLEFVEVWSSEGSLPEPAPHAVTPIPELASRPKAPVLVDPASAIRNVGGVGYLTATIEASRMDGSHNVPVVLRAEAVEPQSGELLSSGETKVKGPGPIAVALPDLTPGRTYRFTLRAGYPA